MLTALNPVKQTRYIYYIKGLNIYYKKTRGSISLAQNYSVPFFRLFQLVELKYEDYFNLAAMFSSNSRTYEDHEPNRQLFIQFIDSCLIGEIIDEKKAQEFIDRQPHLSPKKHYTQEENLTLTTKLLTGKLAENEELKDADIQSILKKCGYNGTIFIGDFHYSVIGTFLHFVRKEQEEKAKLKFLLEEKTLESVKLKYFIPMILTFGNNNTSIWGSHWIRVLVEVEEDITIEKLKTQSGVQEVRITQSSAKIKVKYRDSLATIWCNERKLKDLFIQGIQYTEISAEGVKGSEITGEALEITTITFSAFPKAQIIFDIAKDDIPQQGNWECGYLATQRLLADEDFNNPQCVAIQAATPKAIANKQKILGCENNLYRLRLCIYEILIQDESIPVENFHDIPSTSNLAWPAEGQRKAITAGTESNFISIIPYIRIEEAAEERIKKVYKDAIKTENGQVVLDLQIFFPPDEEPNSLTEDEIKARLRALIKVLNSSSAPKIILKNYDLLPKKDSVAIRLELDKLTKKIHFEPEKDTSDNFIANYLKAINNRNVFMRIFLLNKNENINQNDPWKQFAAKIFAIKYQSFNPFLNQDFAGCSNQNSAGLSSCFLLQSQLTKFFINFIFGYELEQLLKYLPAINLNQQDKRTFVIPLFNRVIPISCEEKNGKDQLSLRDFYEYQIPYCFASISALGPYSSIIRYYHKSLVPKNGMPLTCNEETTYDEDDDNDDKGITVFCDKASFLYTWHDEIKELLWNKPEILSDIEIIDYLGPDREKTKLIKKYLQSLLTHLKGKKYFPFTALRIPATILTKNDDECFELFCYLLQELVNYPDLKSILYTFPISTMVNSYSIESSIKKIENNPKTLERVKKIKDIFLSSELDINFQFRCPMTGEIFYQVSFFAELNEIAKKNSEQKRPITLPVVFSLTITPIDEELHVAKPEVSLPTISTAVAVQNEAQKQTSKERNQQVELNLTQENSTATETQQQTDIDLDLLTSEIIPVASLSEYQTANLIILLSGRFFDHLRICQYSLWIGVFNSIKFTASITDAEGQGSFKNFLRKYTAGSEKLPEIITGFTAAAFEILCANFYLVCGLSDIENLPFESSGQRKFSVRKNPRGEGYILDYTENLVTQKTNPLALQGRDDLLLKRPPFFVSSDWEPEAHFQKVIAAKEHIKSNLGLEWLNFLDYSSSKPSWVVENSDGIRFLIISQLISRRSSQAVIVFLDKLKVLNSKNPKLYVWFMSIFIDCGIDISLNPIKVMTAAEEQNLYAPQKPGDLELKKKLREKKRKLEYMTEVYNIPLLVTESLFEGQRIEVLSRLSEFTESQLVWWEHLVAIHAETFVYPDLVSLCDGFEYFMAELEKLGIKTQQPLPNIFYTQQDRLRYDRYSHNALTTMSFILKIIANVRPNMRNEQMQDLQELDLTNHGACWAIKNEGFCYVHKAMGLSPEEIDFQFNQDYLSQKSPDVYYRIEYQDLKFIAASPFLKNDKNTNRFVNYTIVLFHRLVGGKSRINSTYADYVKLTDELKKIYKNFQDANLSSALINQLIINILILFAQTTIRDGNGNFSAEEAIKELEKIFTREDEEYYLKVHKVLSKIIQKLENEQTIMPTLDGILAGLKILLLCEDHDIDNKINVLFTPGRSQKVFTALKFFDFEQKPDNVALASGGFFTTLNLLGDKDFSQLEIGILINYFVYHAKNSDPAYLSLNNLEPIISKLENYKKTNQTKFLEIINKLNLPSAFQPSELICSLEKVELPSVFNALQQAMAVSSNNLETQMNLPKSAEEEEKEREENNCDEQLSDLISKIDKKLADNKSINELYPHFQMAKTLEAMVEGKILKRSLISILTAINNLEGSVKELRSILDNIFSESLLGQTLIITQITDGVVKILSANLTIEQKCQLLKSFIAAPVIPISGFFAKILEIFADLPSKKIEKKLFDFFYSNLAQSPILAKLLTTLEDKEIYPILLENLNIEDYKKLLKLLPGNPEQRKALLKVIAYSCIARDYPKNREKVFLSKNNLAERLKTYLQDPINFQKLMTRCQKKPYPTMAFLEALLIKNKGESVEELIKKFALDPYNRRQTPKELQEQFKTDGILEKIEEIQDLNALRNLPRSLRAEIFQQFLSINAFGSYLPLPLVRDFDFNSFSAFSLLDRLTLDSIRNQPVKDLSNESIKKLVSYCREKIIAADLSPEEKKVFQLSLIALIREAMYRATGKMPYAEQIIALICAIIHDKNIFFEIDAGEGKSITINLWAITEWAKGCTVDLWTRNPELAERDQKFFASFYDLLGIETALINSKSKYEDYKPGGINFGSFYDMILFSGERRVRQEKLPDQVSLGIDEEDETTLDRHLTHTLAIPSDPNASPHFNKNAPAYYLISEFIQKHKEQILDGSYIPSVADLKRFINERLKLMEEKKAKELIAIFTNNETKLLGWLHAAISAFSLKAEDPNGYRMKDQTIYLDGKKVQVKEVQVLCENQPQTENSKFSHEVHQFLCARLNLEQHTVEEEENKEVFLIDPTEAILFSLTVKNAIDYNLQRGGKVFGFTGTAGSEDEISEQANKYGFVTYKIPRRKVSKRKDQGIIFVKHKDGQTEEQDLFQAALKLIQIKKSSQQPILIFVATIEESERLNAFLQTQMPPEKIQLYNGKSGTQEDTINQAGEKGQITISVIGLMERGADFITDHPEGFYEINLMLGERILTTREKGQVCGRIARNGMKGETVILLPRSAKGRVEARIKEIELARTRVRAKNEIIGDIRNQYFLYYEKFLHFMKEKFDELKLNWLVLKEVEDGMWTDFLTSFEEQVQIIMAKEGLEFNDKINKLTEVINKQWQDTLKALKSAAKQHIIKTLPDFNLNFFDQEVDNLLTPKAEDRRSLSIEAHNSESQKPLRIKVTEIEEVTSVALAKQCQGFLTPEQKANALEAEIMLTCHKLKINPNKSFSAILKEFLKKIQQEYSAAPKNFYFPKKASVIQEAFKSLLTEVRDLGDEALKEKIYQAFKKHLLTHKNDGPYVLYLINEMRNLQKRGILKPDADISMQSLLQEKGKPAQDKWEEVKKLVLYELQKYNQAYFKSKDRKEKLQDLLEKISFIAGDNEAEKILALIDLVQKYSDLAYQDDHREDSRSKISFFGKYRNPNGSRFQEVLYKIKSLAIAALFVETKKPTELEEKEKTAIYILVNNLLCQADLTLAIGGEENEDKEKLRQLIENFASNSSSIEPITNLVQILQLLKKWWEQKPQKLLKAQKNFYVLLTSTIKKIEQSMLLLEEESNCEKMKVKVELASQAKLEKLLRAQGREGSKGKSLEIIQLEKAIQENKVWQEHNAPNLDEKLLHLLACALYGAAHCTKKVFTTAEHIKINSLTLESLGNNQKFGFTIDFDYQKSGSAKLLHESMNLVETFQTG